MAVSSVSSSSSIYGNRNVLTGLASGMDTESLIENVISSYKNKIATLTQKRTKTEWKQEAYQSIINKMSTFTDKYTSYRSSNNLMSTSFFDQAVKTVAKGANADKVSATGRASSNVQVDRVRQLATAATYKLSGRALDQQTSDFGSNQVSAAAAGTLDLDKNMTVSKLSGNMTLAYGGSSDLSYLYIDFDETKTYANAQELADEINRQLSEQTVNIGSSSYTGQELLNNVIKAEVDNVTGKIGFTDPKSNNVYVSSASDSVKERLLSGQDPSSVDGKQIKTLSAGSYALASETMSTIDYLNSRNSSMEITLDGVTKTVQLPGKLDESKLPAKNDPNYAKERDAAYLKAFQANIDSAFGKNSDGTSKLTVSDKNGDAGGIQFQFTAAQKGSTFSVYSDKGETLGLGDSKKVTSYLNTSKTLGELLGEDGLKKLEGSAIKKPVKDQDGNIKTDYDGNPIYEKDGNGNYVYETDSNGNTLYTLAINGKEVGRFTKDSTLSEVFNAMNSSSDSEVKVGYSKLTNELTFTAKETGAASKVDFGAEGTLANALFGVQAGEEDLAKSTSGQDAILEVSVNGTSLGEITRSSNSVELDGMTINLKGTFGYETDEDGNIKYNVEQAKDAAGNSLFYAYQGQGKEAQFAAEKMDDGRFKFTDDRTGKTVYGTMDSDGNLTFEMQNQNRDQVFVQSIQDGKVRFTADPSQKLDVGAVTEKTAVKDNKTEAVTFETSSDADKIVDAVKAMIDDYNAMATEIKNAYSTLPVQRSNGAYYEPLTDEEQEGMSESTINAWEEKAKTGILFGDTTLSNLYRSITRAVSMTGEYGETLRKAGITVNYSNGLSTLDFNETEFRAALESDPDKVRDAFTASTDNGAKSNGLMQALKQPLDAYGKTTGGKGILVEYAGSPLAPSTMYSNKIQTELNNIDTQIEKWQDKMSDQVDYYTNKFSQLEQLVQQMNSQSSYFSQLMGG